MEQTQYDTIIIGGGHNGLATAGYLAKEGLKVLVLERLDRVGGAVVSEELTPGFTVPYCSYVLHILQGRVIDDLELRENGLDIIPFVSFRLDPFPDGRYILTHREHHKNAEELRKFSEHDARAYPDWANFWERASGLLHRYWFREPPTLAQVSEDIRGTSDEEVWDTMLTVSMRDLIDRHFQDPTVKAHFIDAQDAGDPSAPGSILSLAYLRVNQFTKPENYGIPRGGMSQLAFAMARSAEARGVEVRLNVRVDKVIVEDGEAKGVRLSNGEEIRSFMVVSNADPKRTYGSLVDPSDLDEATSKKVKGLTTRANCVKLLAALKERPDFSRYLGAGYDPRLGAYFRICPSVDYYQQSWDDAKNGLPSSCPVMNVQIPSIYDSSLAPPGHHVLSAWTLYAPTHLKEGSWETEGPRVGEQLIDLLSEYLPNFRESVIDWTLQTPQDIETREFMTDGSIRHIDITSRQIFTGRMPYRSPINRLYLCGSGTHPGGEITGVPGHNAARAILKDLEKVAV
ncbi:MAG: NAD(P)/FAD-dependent oxidoreductase [Chloroflexi bacterium]|nr:NAD(P)/FAD-dependent oxidoreductase [Chloroflexota bacterium]